MSQNCKKLGAEIKFDLIFDDQTLAPLREEKVEKVSKWLSSNTPLIPLHSFFVSKFKQKQELSN